jgi:hypothetical protein
MVILFDYIPLASCSSASIEQCSSGFTLLGCVLAICLRDVTLNWFDDMLVTLQSHMREVKDQ